jgi:ribosomal protein S18 acetylase RimI-like enzyme
LAFVIFPAGPQDAEALAAVHVAAWRETYRGLLPDAYLDRMEPAPHARRFAQTLTAGQETVLAAGDRARLVGYAAGGPSRRAREHEAEVTTLYLLRRAQGQGLGRRLMQAAARVLAANGATSLMVSVLRDNAHARGFYEHLGGQAEPIRVERGPGGLNHELAYRWPDIRTLC